MTIHTLPRHNLAEYRDQCEADYWDDRHDYSAYLGTDCCDCDGEDNDVTALVAQMRARAAVMLARVRAKSRG